MAPLALPSAHPAGNPIYPRFRTKAGRLTNYALGCGYVESVEIGSVSLSLWHEGGPCLHVRAHDHGENFGRLFWETFETLTDARRRFDRAKREIKAAQMPRH